MSKTAERQPDPQQRRNAMDMTPTEIIGIEAVDKLRAAGFEIVPKEPTDEMLKVGARATVCVYEYVREAWIAMITAANDEAAKP